MSGFLSINFIPTLIFPYTKLHDTAESEAFNTKSKLFVPGFPNDYFKSD